MPLISHESLPRVTPATTFSLAQARQIVKDDFEPNPWIYWTDFLASNIAGTVCFMLVRKFPLFSLAQVLLFLASCLLFYRCVLFIHELVHLKSTSFRAFRMVWNLLCGIPFLIPSFLYYTHLDHHRRKHYGTPHDGEYIPLGNQSIGAILFYLSQILIIPALAIARFMILTPLTWFIPAVRRWVFKHASSMIMEPAYVRPMPTPQVLRIWRLQEFGCLVVCWTVAVLLYRGQQPGVTQEMLQTPIRNGVLPFSFLVQAYLTSLVIVGLNAVRTLGAHRFLGDGQEMTFNEQLLDSVNYPRRPLLTGLWAPVGLQFHALHHLFPSLPYHNLRRAHNKLMRELPENSLYRLTNADSLWSVLAGLFAAAKDAQQRKAAAQPQGDLVRVA
ncbi:MAG: fatty acid desaturase [Pirellulales bacterium]|nr:fatty acid desaturase [Pirellulales bacterium]